MIRAIINWWRTTKCPTCWGIYWGMGDQSTCEDCLGSGRVDKRLVNMNTDTLPRWIGDPPSKRRRVGDSRDGTTEVPV